MAKSKKPTLRQRLRADAETLLDKMVEDMQGRALEAVAGSSVDPALLMQLASQPGSTKTLRNNLITVLANDAEDELERIYNNQMKLPGVDDE